MEVNTCYSTSRDRNKLCCESGITGVIENNTPIAGRCVSSARVESFIKASLTSAGSQASLSGSNTDSAVQTVVSTVIVVSVAASTQISNQTTFSTQLPSITLLTSMTPSASSTGSVSSIETSKLNSTSYTELAPTPTQFPSLTPSPTTLATNTTKTPIPATSTSTGTAGKPVFIHYMVNGIEDAHIEQDVKDIVALGIDAVALNLNTVTESWATKTVDCIFVHAEANGLKLFFSFDMTGFNNPDEFIIFLQSYVTKTAHYTYNGLPFVSTFNGGASEFAFGESTVNDGWKVKLQEEMFSAGHPIYFVPSFQDTPCTETFFSTEFPALDGIFNWNSWAADGSSKVTTTQDTIYLSSAQSSAKSYMMGISPLQFKHMDAADNWYIPGPGNMEDRFSQVLNLQPDFIELQTWNDGGEGHYMGNIWSEAYTTVPQIMASIAHYNHTAYNQVLPSFIKAYKAGVTSTSTMYPTNGKNAQGLFYNHALLKNADCSADRLGRPTGADLVEDVVAGMILIARGEIGYTATVSVGGNTLGSAQKLSPGFNAISIDGLTAGKVTMTVKDASGTTVISGTGSQDVLSSSSLCNYNFQVVALA
ncbi:glycosyl hydrolase family 71-domain-containing protein [Calycina marina]|uniref:Glycosyl hydrolase family 71-domain-containing protein n=1 Tax=Calycina marina TaxID=1763456 RepID=A0A9P7ZB86_9HELO|nr:glycosyl hydrolase family 71-domain-containing protein [Calycina marina]